MRLCSGEMPAPAPRALPSSANSAVFQTCLERKVQNLECGRLDGGGGGLKESTGIVLNKGHD